MHRIEEVPVRFYVCAWMEDELGYMNSVYLNRNRVVKRLYLTVYARRRMVGLKKGCVIVISRPDGLFAYEVLRIGNCLKYNSQWVYVLYVRVLNKFDVFRADRVFVIKD